MTWVIFYPNKSYAIYNFADVIIFHVMRDYVMRTIKRFKYNFTGVVYFTILQNHTLLAITECKITSNKTWLVKKKKKYVYICEKISKITIQQKPNSFVLNKWIWLAQRRFLHTGWPKHETKQINPIGSYTLPLFWLAEP